MLPLYYHSHIVHILIIDIYFFSHTKYLVKLSIYLFKMYGQANV